MKTEKTSVDSGPRLSRLLVDFIALAQTASILVKGRFTTSDSFILLNAYRMHGTLEFEVFRLF
jgi:hypothetical protein